jgi:hypothetical protein
MSLKYEEVAKHNKVRTPDPPILVSQVANSFFPFLLCRTMTAGSLFMVSLGMSQR